MVRNICPVQNLRELVTFVWSKIIVCTAFISRLLACFVMESPAREFQAAIKKSYKVRIVVYFRKEIARGNS